MTVLGRLLRNRRADEQDLAWNRANLAGPETITLTSENFGNGDTMPRAHAAKYAHGEDISPPLSWTELPAGTAQLLLVIEDVDVPVGKPAVHCLVVIDPTVGQLEPGALAAKRPGAGVRILRSTIGRGYHGPAPIKGHGPHRYVFQLFALSSPITAGGGPDADAATGQDRTKPRTVLSGIAAPVLGRGRLTGVYER